MELSVYIYICSWRGGHDTGEVGEKEGGSRNDMNIAVKYKILKK